MVTPNSGTKKGGLRWMLLAAVLCAALLGGCGGVGATNAEDIPPKETAENKEPSGSGDGEAEGAASQEADAAASQEAEGDDSTKSVEPIDAYPVSDGQGPDWLRCQENRGQREIFLTYMAGDNAVLKITIRQDGAKISEYPANDMRAELRADGSLTVTDPVGVVTEVPASMDSLSFSTPDGTRMTKREDGLIRMDYPDGAVGSFWEEALPAGRAKAPTGIRYPFGMTSKMDSGEWIFRTYLGQYALSENECRLDFPEGVSVLFREDGHTTTTYPNGAEIRVSGGGDFAAEYRGMSDKGNAESSTLSFHSEGSKTTVEKDATETVYNPGGVTVRVSASPKGNMVVKYPDGFMTLVKNGELLGMTLPGADEVIELTSETPNRPSEEIVPPPESAPPGETTGDAETSPPEPVSPEEEIPPDEPTPPPEDRGSVFSQVARFLVPLILIIGAAVAALISKRMKTERKRREPTTHTHKQTSPGNSKPIPSSPEKEKNPDEESPTDTDSKEPEGADETPQEDSRDASREEIYLGYAPDAPFPSGSAPVLTPKDGGEMLVYGDAHAPQGEIKAYPTMRNIPNAEDTEGYIDARYLRNGPVKDCFWVDNLDDYTGEVFRIRVQSPAILEVDGDGKTYVLKYRGHITLIGTKE